MKHQFKSSPMGKFRETQSHVVVNQPSRDYGHYERFMHCLDREARQMSAANALKWPSISETTGEGMIIVNSITDKNFTCVYGHILQHFRS